MSQRWISSKFWRAITERNNATLIYGVQRHVWIEIMFSHLVMFGLKIYMHFENANTAGFMPTHWDYFHQIASIEEITEPNIFILSILQRMTYWNRSYANYALSKWGICFSLLKLLHEGGYCGQNIENHDQIILWSHHSLPAIILSSIWYLYRSL